MEDLKGEIVSKVEVNDDNTIMVFTTKSGKKIAFKTQGDCCSYSWFAHTENIKVLFGNEIIDVVERQEWTDDEQKKAESEGDYEVLSLYGWLLKTKKGTCDVEFRNDSNGYYGGWCQRISSVDKNSLTEVKEDF